MDKRVRMDWVCAKCSALLDAANPPCFGGGGVDEDGNWYESVIGKCCQKPITEAQMKEIMAAVFKSNPPD